jgi:hypothetical protein
MLAASRHCGATPLAVTCNISPLHRNGATFPPVTFDLHPLVPRALVETLHCNVSTCTLAASRLPPSPSRRIPRAPHPLPPPPPPLPPLPVRAQRRCTPPRCCPTFNVQRSTFTPLAPLASRPPASPLSPHPRAPHPLPPPPPPLPPAAGPGAAPLHPSTLLSHVQRATFNLHPLAPLAARLSPRPSRLLPHPSRSCDAVSASMTSSTSREASSRSRVTCLKPGGQVG